MAIVEYGLVVGLQFHRIRCAVLVGISIAYLRGIGRLDRLEEGG